MQILALGNFVTLYIPTLENQKSPSNLFYPAYIGSFLLQYCCQQLKAFKSFFWVSQYHPKCQNWYAIEYKKMKMNK